MNDARADGAPLIEIVGLVKQYGALRPLRVLQLAVSATDRLAVGGLDAGGAEMFVHLVTGAALADEGGVRVAGRDTRQIATDTEWLTSLDRFGIVTERAILIEQISIASNLALPISLAIDPMADAVRQQVEALARVAGIAAARLEAAASTLDPEERVRVHLARALAASPELVLLEHPTARLADQAASTRVGETLRRAADARAVGFLALTEDAAFARAAGARRLRLKPATGAVVADSPVGRFFGR